MRVSWRQKANNEKTVVSSAPQPPAESWGQQTYIRTDISPATLSSHFLPLSCLSAVWHQSLQRKGVCSHSFLSQSLFSLLFIWLSLFYSTTNLSNLVSSWLLNWISLKLWVPSRWQRDGEKGEGSDFIAFLIKIKGFCLVCVVWVDCFVSEEMMVL